MTKNIKNRILVATDLSKNSKAGVKFAIQLATQSGATLIVYHVIEIPRPTRWSDKKYEIFTNEQIADAEVKLSRFVKGIYRSSQFQAGNLECVVEAASPVSRAIMDYGKKRKVNFICLSTRGAGMVRRFMGTHTSTILRHSTIPVFAIPKNYRTTPIFKLLYFTDLSSVDRELRIVKEFADVTRSKVSVVHYDYLYRLSEMQNKLNKTARRYKGKGVEFHLMKLSIEDTFQIHLKKSVRKFKPSVVVLFTKQRRDWFERLFLSSKSADASYDTEKPILIIPKT